MYDILYDLKCSGLVIEVVELVWVEKNGVVIFVFCVRKLYSECNWLVISVLVFVGILVYL